MKKSQEMAAYIAAKKAQAKVDNSDPFYKGQLNRSFIQPQYRLLETSKASRTNFEAKAIIRKTVTRKYATDKAMQSFH